LQVQFSLCLTPELSCPRYARASLHLHACPATEPTVCLHTSVYEDVLKSELLLPRDLTYVCRPLLYRLSKKVPCSTQSITGVQEHSHSRPARTQIAFRPVAVPELPLLVSINARPKWSATQHPKTIIHFCKYAFPLLLNEAAHENGTKHYRTTLLVTKQ
jgi:hypothetical protein